MSRTLVSIQPGESARVASVGGEAGAARRLMDLGLIRGTPIRVVRVAPLGDPIEVSVRGFMLSLRRAEAEHVVVD
ncbi:MAG: ferrous iron transport protein A [Gemmatimonas sp.]|nr:ferrous iron transport protein A [Gemmatimonas sp.]